MNLEKEEIEQFRAPKEYLRWFDTVLDRMHSLGSSARSDILLHRGIFKVIHEELFPLRSILSVRGDEWRESRFRNVIGNQNFDVEVRNHDLEYFEITTTDFDDGEAFRMKEFIDRGTVSTSAPVIRNVQGRPVDLYGRDESHSVDNRLSEEIDAIKGRVIQKSGKEYPDNTGLLVSFNDSSTHYRDSHLDQIRAAVDSIRPYWVSSFRAIYIVGSREKVCIENLA